MIVFKILFGLLGLSLVVVIHEAGHFFAAKLSGIRVEAFSLGWGKILLAKEWKGTEYRLSLFPLGGYCKMQGEQALVQAWESHARQVETEPGDMYAASFRKRIFVALSGPIFNLFFAGLIFFTIALIGYPISYYPPRIVLASEYTERQSYPADLGGLETGDLITAVDGRELYRFDQLQKEVAVHAETPLALSVRRGTEKREIRVTPELNRQSGAGYLGIFPWIDPVLRSLPSDPSFPALKEGDRILSYNGQAIDHAVQLSALMKEEAAETIEVLREDRRVTLSLPSPLMMENFGIQYDFIESRTPSWRIGTAFGEGIAELKQTLGASIKGFALLFKGVDLQSAVSGPLRITYMTGDLAFSGFENGAEEGFLSFFRFLALINVALFIMNLLPIPVLDGGQILLFLMEGIFRKKPSPKVIYRYQMLGTVLVFGLIIFATMNDILFFSRN